MNDKDLDDIDLGGFKDVNVGSFFKDLTKKLDVPSYFVLIIHSSA